MTSCVEIKKDRPEDSKCGSCGAIVEARWREPVLGMSGRWIAPAEICSDCFDKQKIEADRLSSIEQRRSEIAGAFPCCGFTPRMKSRTFEAFHKTHQNKSFFSIADNYDAATQDGLSFYGPCGTGKTMLASAIANKWASELDVLFISCPQFLSDIRSSFSSGAFHDKLKIAQKASLLVLDDIGAEKPTDWVREQLYLLVDYRCEHFMPIVATSNCNIKQLGEQLGDRIASRFAQMCQFVQFSGKDARVLMRAEKQKGAV